MNYEWGGFTLDVAARRLCGPDGDAVHVEPQVFDVLTHLVENHERVVTKAELLDSVWGDQFVSESALTTRIKEVRRALGDDGRTQKFVRNVHGRGYQFVGELEAVPRSIGAADDQAGADGRLALAIAVDTEYPFVGRESEIAAVELKVDHGTGSTQVLIAGSPGLGKSRLAIELLERAATRGALVGAGRCDEQLTTSLQPVRDAIAGMARDYPRRFATWSSGIEGPLVYLIPSVSGLLGVESSPVDGYAGIDVLITVLERAAAEMPVWLLIDDIQWSDEPTRALLAQLHRRFGHRPLTTISTFRAADTDLRAGARQWIAGQARLPDVIRIDLGELDDDSAAELIASVLGSGDRPATGELIERTGGHTLFLTEILRDRSRGVTTSGSVNEVVSARLEQLAEPVRQLVRAGAVLGPEFSFDTAARGAGLDPVAALDAIDQAVSAELLHETASAARFRFSHQLVPEALRSATPRSTLAQIHQRCAEALAEQGADAVEVAFHVLGAVPLVQMEAAVQQAMDAAATASSENQFDRAVRLLERCVDVGPPTRQRAEVLVALGHARVATGRSEAGVPYLDEAAELARRNGWIDLLVQAALGRFGRSPFRKPNETETIFLIEEALAALPEEPSIERARLLAKLGAFSMFTHRLEYRDELTRRALEMVPDAPPTERMELLESRAIVFSCPAGTEELAKLDGELADLRIRTNFYFADAAAPETLRLMRADGAGLREVAYFDEQRARAQPIAEWRDLVLRSLFAAFDGEFEAAREYCNDAGAIGEPYWGESAPTLQAFGLLFLDSLSDDWGESAELLEVLYAVSEGTLFLPAFGWSSFMIGDVERARECGDELLARKSSFRWFGEHILGGNMLVSSAELGLVLDDDELCDLAEQHLEPYADLVLGTPWACSFAAADSLWRLAARRGDEDAAGRHRARARALYTSLKAPALAARVS